MLDRSSTTFLASRCSMTFQVLALLPYIYLPSGILIVEPHEGLLAARSMLLGAADQSADLSIRTDLEPRQSNERDVTFAVLSESLGYGVLSETAQVIRKNWPRARILILGRSGAAIEDQLYDARIDHRARPEDLLAALLMLAEYPRSQCATPPAISADGRVGRLLNATTPFAKEESDPTKRFANSVPTVYPRGMPSQEQYFRKVS